MCELIKNVDSRYLEAVKLINEHKGYDASIVESPKCNGVQLGMMVREAGSDVAPVILLKPLSDEDTAEDIAEDILEFVKKDSEKGNQSDVYIKALSMIKSFEKARGNISFRVCMSKGNEDILKGVVQDAFLDLTIYYVLQMSYGENTASMRITDEHLLEWGVTQEDIRRIAKENEASMPVYSLSNMGLLGMFFGFDDSVGDVFSPSETVPGGMYKITYESGIGGASLILRNELLKAVADNTGCDLVILPASVDEIIVVPLPEITSSDICTFDNMVQNVNQECFSEEPEYILSDHVYVFGREEERILDMLEVMQKYD